MRTFLGGLVEFAVGLHVKIDIDKVGAGKELDDVSRVVAYRGTQYAPGRPFLR
jgi:hypothetical protein